MSFAIHRRTLVAGLTALSCCAATPALAETSLIERRESKYNTIYIERVGSLIGMMFGVNRKLFTESLYDPADPKSLPVAYTRYMTGALAYPARLDSALEIGMGGGRTASYLTQFMPALKLTCVELDPEVIALAKKYFGVVETPNMRIVAKDGRLYLREVEKTYDLIMIDAYRGTFVPFHLLTKEFFTLVKSRLNPGGAVAQNIEPTTMMYDSAIATLRAVFANVDIYQASGNVVAVAYDGPKRTDADLQARAGALQEKYGFRHELGPLLAVREIVVDARAKPLTDDFAPVESLRAMRRHDRKRTN